VVAEITPSAYLRSSVVASEPMPITAAPAPSPAPLRRHRMSRQERRNLAVGLLFISPWIVGFLAFLVYPFEETIRLSFTKYNGIRSPEFIGLDNYRTLIHDDLFWKVLGNTLYYTGLAVPVGVVAALIMALCMNQDVREQPVYRAILYLPSIIPLFALSFIFLNLMDPTRGLVNRLMVDVGLPNINWFGDPRYGKIAFVILAQFGAGQAALIFLAGLKGIPQHLYEAASIDGAGNIRKFWNITLPMMTPIILYDLILGLSLGIQIFTQVVILTAAPAGSPVNSNLMYVNYIYSLVFRDFRSGYASALALVLFLITVVLALVIFRWSKSWVNYETV
jgi:multiple sugar transport system permease protein